MAPGTRYRSHRSASDDAWQNWPDSCDPMARVKPLFIDNGEPFLVEYNLQQSREGFATEEAARRRYNELCGPSYHDASARILKRYGGKWVDITTPHCPTTPQKRPASPIIGVRRSRQ